MVPEMECIAHSIRKLKCVCVCVMVCVYGLNSPSAPFDFPQHWTWGGLIHEYKSNFFVPQGPHSNHDKIEWTMGYELSSN